MAATPKTVTDGSSDLDEAVLNMFVRGGKLQVKVNYVAIDFDSATNTPTLISGVDSDGEIVNGDLSWDGGDLEIDVVLSGFSTKPVIILSKGGEWAASNVDDLMWSADSATLAHVWFVNGASDTAVDPNGDVRFSMLVIGA